MPSVRDLPVVTTAHLWREPACDLPSEGTQPPALCRLSLEPLGGAVDFSPFQPLVPPSPHRPTPAQSSPSQAHCWMQVLEGGAFGVMVSAGLERITVAEET